MGYKTHQQHWSMRLWQRSKRGWMETEYDDVDFGSPRRYRTRRAYVVASMGYAIARHVRILACTVALAVTLTVYLVNASKRPHHRPWLAPTTSDHIVHGARVEGLPEPSYPLEAFPASPMRTGGGYFSDDDVEDGVLGKEVTAERPPWLATVISAAFDIDRRMLIRSSWMRLYKDLPMDMRFVISNPGSEWTDAVRLENSTFGDMIVLDHLQEDDITANTIKTIEMYQWLIDHGQQYEFVSKMDTDVFFNARAFWERFLLPRLSNATDPDGGMRATVERTVIGELYYSKVYDLVFPHGAMYTFTWDMVETLAELQREHQVVTGEDMTLAMLLLKSHEVVNFVNFRGTEKFDFDPYDTRGDGTAWAREGTHPSAIRHALYGDEAIAVHQLKSDRDFLMVSDCFDEKGIIAPPPVEDTRDLKSTPFSLRWHDFWYELNMSKRYETRFGRVPEFLWTLVDGTWRCDDIWDLGTKRDGFQ